MFNFNNIYNQNQIIVKYQNTFNSKVKKSVGKKHDETANISKARAWGILTWMLFHTLAEKIKPEKFKKYSSKIISLFREVCLCLPCPYCREDARKYLSSFNFKLIKSKEDWKLFLYDFHNHVNQKIGNETPSDNILEKYKTLDILYVVNMWTQYFTRYGIESQEFIEGMQREKIKKEMYLFITKNISIFY